MGLFVLACSGPVAVYDDTRAGVGSRVLLSSSASACILGCVLR